MLQASENDVADRLLERGQAAEPSGSISMKAPSQARAPVQSPPLNGLIQTGASVTWAFRLPAPLQQRAQAAGFPQEKVALLVLLCDTQPRPLS